MNTSTLAIVLLCMVQFAFSQARNYGPSNSMDEFAQKAQLLAAMNSKSIWEV